MFGLSLSTLSNNRFDVSKNRMKALSLESVTDTKQTEGSKEMNHKTQKQKKKYKKDALVDNTAAVLCMMWYTIQQSPYVMKCKKVV